MVFIKNISPTIQLIIKNRPYKNLKSNMRHICIEKEIEDTNNIYESDSVEAIPEKSHSSPNTQIETGDAVIAINKNKVLFYGQVSATSCFHLQNVLSELSNELSIQEINWGIKPIIHLHIQSNGGELMPTFYVADFIQNMKVPVYTYIDSFAASAATLLSVVGKKRFMTKNSLVLIHQLSTQISGKYKELNTEMSNLQTIMENVKIIYLNNTFIEEEDLNKLLATDVWLNSSSALELGIVDFVL